MTEQVAFTIADPSGAAEARRHGVAMAEQLGFGETARGKVALVITEIATNLAKHARGGQLIVQVVSEDGRRGLHVLSLDRGPGMASPGEALRDGYSTAGSAGTGLGAISRLADVFEMHSTPGRGTTLMARLWPGPRPGSSPPPALEVAGLCTAMASETVCGDAWARDSRPDGLLMLVVDGLGHGVGAAEAAARAVAIFQEHLGLAPAEILECLHAGLRSTRGAAAAVIDVDLAREMARFAGVGNITATIADIGKPVRHLVSHNGTLGHQARRIAEFTYPFRRGALLIMHTDGLQQRWSLDAYPGLAARHPAVVTGTLYRDFRRGSDDVAVVAARAATGPAA
jgi:anti-sigma regulatory factor (Ser/Thr protein kinase)